MNKCTVVAKREIFFVWPFGLAAWLAGLIFIDRVKGEKARQVLNTVNTKIKQQNIKLWVFPEGTRRNTGELHSFKKGAFHLAIDEQIPIMPVVFSSYCTFLNDKKKILNAGNVIITALQPIPTKGLTKKDMPELMEKVHATMLEAYKQASAEVLRNYQATKQLRDPTSVSADDSAKQCSVGASSIKENVVEATVGSTLSKSLEPPTNKPETAAVEEVEELSEKQIKVSCAQALKTT